MSKSTYEIRITGTAPLRPARELPSDRIGGTRWHDLASNSIGRCRLVGLLDALRDAGIELIEVRRETGPNEYQNT